MPPSFSLTTPSQHPVIRLIGEAGAPISFKPSYTAPTLINLWANLGSGFQEAGYYKDADGLVHLAGMVTGGGLTSMFVLPTGFRPLTKHRFAVLANGALGYVDILADGNVTLVAGAPWVSLDGISFLAEQ